MFYRTQTSPSASALVKLYTVHLHLGPVVQSMVGLTHSLRGQLVRCFMTLLPNILGVVGWWDGAG